MKARFYKQQFPFKRPSGTSRGVLTHKESWFIELSDDRYTGLGECSVIPGLSPDFQDETAYEKKLFEVVELLESGGLTFENSARLLHPFPSILFGVETAFLDMQNGGKGIIFENEFSRGERAIPINGLIWMGDEGFMSEQIEQKLAEGFSTIKMKIGAIDFATEYKLLSGIRKRYNSNELTLRVDANGAFSFDESILVLEQLAELEIHSIEQPIGAGQFEKMAQLCSSSPIAIALDEELIGVSDVTEKTVLLDKIKPPFIILKPSLHGGIQGCAEWIRLAEERAIGWWMTSALESNVGLNAICQFAGQYTNDLPQGLGTGSLYTWNTPGLLEVKDGYIRRLVHSGL